MGSATSKRVRAFFYSRTNHLLAFLDPRTNNLLAFYDPRINNPFAFNDPRTINLLAFLDPRTNILLEFHDPRTNNLLAFLDPGSHESPCAHRPHNLSRTPLPEAQKYKLDGGKRSPSAHSVLLLIKRSKQLMKRI